MVVGTRSHWTLHAQLVLFSPLSASDVAARTNQGTTTGTTGTTGSNTGSTAYAPVHW
jgi:phosphopantothenoylcysteine synthetase/decarboxylase